MDRNSRVVVVMSRNDCFPWQNGPRFLATLKRKPSGPGDTYTVDVDGYEGVQINGNSQDFVGLYPVEGGEE